MSTGSAPNCRRYSKTDAAKALAVAMLISAAAPTARAQIEPVQWTPPEVEAVLLEDYFDQQLDEDFIDDVSNEINRLDSPVYSQRRAATTRLTDLGPQILPLLQKAYAEATVFETRLRLEEIIYESYLLHFVYGRNAFLGISQHAQNATSKRHPQVPEGHVGIVINRIIPDTAAERAGLEARDVIIALDGQPIPSHGVRSNQAFGESIRTRGPGARVTLTVVRDESTFDLDVILGSRPRSLYDRQGVVTEMLRFYNKAFRTFWKRRFAPQDAPQERDGEIVDIDPR